jgi:hypothetical protein
MDIHKFSYIYILFKKYLRNEEKYAFEINFLGKIYMLFLSSGDIIL